MSDGKALAPLLRCNRSIGQGRYSFRGEPPLDSKEGFAGSVVALDRFLDCGNALDQQIGLVPARLDGLGIARDVRDLGLGEMAGWS